MHADVAFRVIAGNLLSDHLFKQRDIKTANCRDKHRIRIFRADFPQERWVLKSINFVEDLNDIVMLNANILESLPHHKHLIFKPWMTDIDDMEQKIGLQYLVKR